jgi:ubiquinone/menaquinone biosynthesis C-methylase UbiE
MLQAQLFDRFTRRLLEDAGLRAGMQVLDVGTGAGDVALVAAELVGPSGEVVGVDVDPTVLATARARAREREWDNVTFVEGNCRTLPAGPDFDAVVGRLVLMYQGDVTEALRALVRRVRPGGTLAFAEIDLTTGLGYVRAGAPELMSSVWEWAADAFRRAGAHIAMAPLLHRAFVECGLGEPEMSLHARLGCGRDWAGYRWAAELMRSLTPVLEKFGIVTADVLDVDTLAERLRDEALRTGFPFMVVPLVAAWGRKPLD